VEEYHICDILNEINGHGRKQTQSTDYLNRFLHFPLIDNICIYKLHIHI